MSDTPPIACSLAPQDLAGRKKEAAALLAASTGREALSDGHAFIFPNDSALATRLVDFIVRERECCPFLTFELSFEPAGGPIRLTARGPEEAAAFIGDLLK